MESQIAEDVLDLFVPHLDTLGRVKKLSLWLYTRGGNTLAAWTLVNLLKQFCDELEVIIPAKAHSEGTLLTLGAQRVVMTKQATLGPIDPSIQTPFNPVIHLPQGPQQHPVSVESVQGFIEWAKKSIGIESDGTVDIMSVLASSVHPLVLGGVYRSRAQAQMMAKKLLASHIDDKTRVESIVNFLTSEAGSHDYTINRTEAIDLGLNIESPDDELYDLIQGINNSIKEELSLRNPFNPVLELAGKSESPYEAKRCLVESIGGGADVFLSKGTLKRIAHPQQQGSLVYDERTFEGWKQGVVS